MSKLEKVFLSPLIIAEVAQAHEGSLGMAHAFIEAAARAGADAIKFQTHFAAEESTPEEPWRVKFSTQDATRYDYWKRMEFTPDQWMELANHAHERKLLFISSPFSQKAVDVLTKAGVDIWKIASGEITNLLMLETIATSKKPVILSTGMSTYDEVRVAVDIFNKTGNELLILQCTSNYPVLPEKLGLNVLSELKTKFNVKVGLSDHSGNIYSGLAAVALGADALEVHVTFNKQMFGPDVPASVTFDDFSRLVEGCSWIKKAVLNPVNKDEMFIDMQEIRKIFMKSFVAKKFIPEGKIIDIDDLDLRKPVTGIPASELYFILGKKTLVSIEKGIFIQENMLVNL